MRYIYFSLIFCLPIFDDTAFAQQDESDQSSLFSRSTKRHDLIHANRFSVGLDLYVLSFAPSINAQYFITNRLSLEAEYIPFLGSDYFVFLKPKYYFKIIPSVYAYFEALFLIAPQEGRVLVGAGPGISYFVSPKLSIDTGIVGITGVKIGTKYWF
ncbi:MAG: hypothetical protein LAT68_13195 [Cyclobacteriaceae bacterium]|nr:hypothetical protein [Cyclobacteriaceae bacterium]MCH8517277.1 hypothetical protein [Cyclobacteriaceae bacterium]